MADTPVRAGYLEGTGGYSWTSGPFVRGELGLRPVAGLSTFVYGEWNRVEPVVGAGVRWEFDW